MLDSKYARHFFSPEELAALRSKWLREGVGESDADEGRGVSPRHDEPSRSV